MEDQSLDYEGQCSELTLIKGPEAQRLLYKYYLTSIPKQLQVVTAAAAAKSIQSCLTLCDPIDCSLPGSSVPGILQARTLECVAISFSNAWKWKVKVKSLSHVRLIATPWTAAYQAPPSMWFSRQEYWSGVPLSSPQVVSSKSQIKSWTLVCQISLPGWKSYFWSHFWPAASNKWRKDFDYLELETTLQIQSFANEQLENAQVIKAWL